METGKTVAKFSLFVSVVMLLLLLISTNVVGKIYNIVHFFSDFDQNPDLDTIYVSSKL